MIYPDLPIKNGDLPVRNDDLPIKNGDDFQGKKNNESWRLSWSPTESGLGVCPGGPNPEALPLGCATTTQVVAGRVTT